MKGSWPRSVALVHESKLLGEPLRAVAERLDPCGEVDRYTGREALDPPSDTDAVDIHGWVLHAR
jgi:hypothetical protein